MTTIAYHHESGIIACDGRIAHGNYISHDKAKKWLCIGDDVWFFAGAVADRGPFIKYHSGELPGAPVHAIDCAAFIVTGGQCFEAGLTKDGDAWRVLLDYNHATGSGRDHAVSAMDHGKGAIDAVIYAATRDMCTGGKISSLELATMIFAEG